MINLLVAEPTLRHYNGDGMNPVLIFLILILAVMIWFFLAKSFRTIGGAANNFVDDVKNAVCEDEDDKEDYTVE